MKKGLEKELQTFLNEVKSIKHMQNDNPLDIDGACKLTGYKKSYIYKLGHEKKIPYYKSNGGKIHYSETELKKWVFRNKHKSYSEIDDEAESTISNMGA